MKLTDFNEIKTRELFQELEFNNLLKRVLTKEKDTETTYALNSSKQNNQYKSQISLFSNEEKQED